MSPLRRRLRWARRGLGYTVLVLLVLVALVLAVANQLLPLAERNPERIAQWLSQRAGQPVAFDRVETAWTRRGPLLQLDNLRLGEGERAFAIGDTEMLVSVYAGLLPGVPFSELRVRGLDLTLERGNDGRWQVRGLPGQQQSGADPFDALERLGELQVIDARLAVVAPALGIDTELTQVDLRLRVDGDAIHAGVRAWPDAEGARPLEAVLELDRDSGDGRVYAGARQTDLAHWSSLLRLRGVTAERGTGRAEAWARLDGFRIDRITVAAALEQVVLGGTPASPTAAVPRVRFDRIDAQARWQTVDGGWRFDAPTLRIDGDRGEHVLDGLQVAVGEQFGLSAPRLDLAPLAQVAALGDPLPAGLRRWVWQAQPRGSLRDVRIEGRRDGPLQASARIQGLGFAPVGDRPGLTGLAGVLEGDRDGVRFVIDDEAPVVFDWPRGFGTAHRAQLAGTLVGWPEGDGWRIGTGDLRVDGDGFGADARGSLWWQGDGTRPWLDLAARVDETALPVARGFWIDHQMPVALVEWLDAALVAGTVRDGRAVIAGDLDDWPFGDHNGRFEAYARITDATVQFQPDWPAVEQVELDAAFVDNGFRLEGTGELAGIRIDAVSASLDHYDHGRLAVDAEGHADAARLVGLLRESPLRALHPETFDQVRASGPAAVDFHLRLPMHDGRLAISGDVELDGASLADPRWELAFDRVSGRAEFDHNGFHADGLQVRHEGRPGVLRLRAGDGHVRDASHVFEAGLQAVFGVDALLARAPELAWLQPHVEGRSRWDIGVSVPKDNRGVAATLRLGSDLVGTALALPAPLAKPAGETLATTIETPLPLDRGEVNIVLGDRAAVRARSGNGRTGVRVALGTDRVEQPPPAAGLVATGRADALDAVEWIALVREGGRGEGPSSFPLQRIDVTAGRLQLLGGVFPDTRVRVDPAGATTVVRADGAALQGELRIPDDDRSAITGRFARVHWRPTGSVGETRDAASPAATERTDTRAATAGHTDPDPDPGIDPAAIPPLRIDVDDLRMIDLALGAAHLRTTPLANGMRIDQLQAGGNAQSITVTGQWLDHGASERTRLNAQIDSKDFGRLLAGLGYGGRLAGGEGQVRFDARWAGGPAEFDLVHLDGELTLAARDGRILELEPGAGRVLGLLSIAELPRRLSLDFRDFFSKGFAFNEVDGRIRFDAGVARSDALRIDGPAAEINIRGAANLRAETFDQTIEVLPKTGNLLTAVGAIAGGPVGAAIGAAANAVLQKPLGQIAAKTYKVTGPWDDPEVEVISREQGRLSAGQAAPAG